MRLYLQLHWTIGHSWLCDKKRIIFYCFCNKPILLSHTRKCKVKSRYEAPAVRTSRQRLEYDRSLFTAAAHRSLHIIWQPQRGTTFIIIHPRFCFKILNNEQLYFTLLVIFSCFISTKNFNSDWRDWKNCFHTFSFEIHWNP